MHIVSGFGVFSAPYSVIRIAFRSVGVVHFALTTLFLKFLVEKYISRIFSCLYFCHACCICHHMSYLKLTGSAVYHKIS